MSFRELCREQHCSFTESQSLVDGLMSFRSLFFFPFFLVFSFLRSFGGGSCVAHIRCMGEQSGRSGGNTLEALSPESFTLSGEA